VLLGGWVLLVGGGGGGGGGGGQAPLVSIPTISHTIDMETVAISWNGRLEQL